MGAGRYVLTLFAFANEDQDMVHWVLMVLLGEFGPFNHLMASTPRETTPE